MNELLNYFTVRGFNRSGDLITRPSKRDSHTWDGTTPYSTATTANQHRFCLNIRAGIVSDRLIGSYLMPQRLTGTVRGHANMEFTARWIGRGAPGAWPARSLDLNPLAFFCGSSSRLWCTTHLLLEEDLLARVMASCDKAQDTTGVFERTHMRNASRPRSVRTVRLEEVIRQHINDMPSTSTRSIARHMGVSHLTVWDGLWVNRRHPYR
ncbi:hypothetical protein PR048_019711 [Dryococelus australis]|uniref:Uncharacterized protein n=1 Tax=Dryococelus australis TaxID=614101 RepID=A0ABQ9H478_9NEOP|nr:hypothetical protein PR048_019711 [Dryococelus australis]